MMTFVAVLHIIVAVLLITLVLVQDSKGDGALGIGGSGSKSLLGATGAQTLAARMTRWTGVLFAITCVTLSLMTASRTKSVLDSGAVLPTKAPQPPITNPAETPTTPGQPAGATSAPAAPAEAAPAAAAVAPATPAPEKK